MKNMREGYLRAQLLTDEEWKMIERMREARENRREKHRIARCHDGPCHYDFRSYDNGNIKCRNCGEGAQVGCFDDCKSDCADRCHYEIVGGGYLCDAPSRDLRCTHCGGIARISGRRDRPDYHYP